MAKNAAKKSKKNVKKSGSSKGHKAKKAVPEIDEQIQIEAAAVVEQEDTSEASSPEPTSSDLVEPQAPVRRRRSNGGEITFVAAEKLLAIVEEVGLKIEEKKAWLKVAGPSGARVYLPRRKVVGRVDIADFEAPSGTSVKLGERSFGAVKEQLDMAGPEERVLENFRSVLRHLASLPAKEPKPRRKARIVVEGVELQA